MTGALKDSSRFRIAKINQIRQKIYLGSKMLWKYKNTTQLGTMYSKEVAIAVWSERIALKELLCTIKIYQVRWTIKSRYQLPKNNSDINCQNENTTSMT